MAEPAKLAPPAVAPRKSSTQTADNKAPGLHSSGKRAPPPPPSSRSESSLAPAPPPQNDDFEAPPPPIDDETAPAPPPETDEEVIAAAVANISMGDVENSATFKPFDALFDKEDLEDSTGGEENALGMESIDIAQQLKDQEVNEPSIDDL